MFLISCCHCSISSSQRTISRRTPMMAGQSSSPSQDASPNIWAETLLRPCSTGCIQLQENHPDVGNPGKCLEIFSEALCAWWTSYVPSGEKILFVFSWDHFNLFLNNTVYKTNSSSSCNNLLSRWHGTFVPNAGFNFKYWIFPVLSSFLLAPAGTYSMSNWIKVATKRYFNIFIHTTGDCLSVFCQVLTCGCTRVYLLA